MTQYTKVNLLKTKKEIIAQVEEGKLGIKTAFCKARRVKPLNVKLKTGLLTTKQAQSLTGR